MLLAPGSREMVKYDTVNIAVVVSASNLTDTKKPCATYQSIASAIKSDIRYNVAKVSIEAWDNTVDWTQYSHIVLASGITYSHCPQQFIEWIDGLSAPTKTRVFNPPHIIKWNMDKLYLIEMKNKGIRIPASVFILQEKRPTLIKVLEMLNDQLEQPISDVIIIKSKVDAGGRSTQKLMINDLTTATVLFDRFLQENSQNGVIVQEYLENITTEGEWSVVLFNREISHIVLKKTSQDGFKVQSEYGGTKIPVEIHDAPKEIVEFSYDVINTVAEEKLLYARVDIVNNKLNLPCLMELEAFEPNLYISNPKIANTFFNAICSY